MKTAFLTTLLKWSEPWEDEADVPLDKYCQLCGDLNKVLASSAASDVADNECHQAAKKACFRLEQKVGVFGKSWAVTTWKAQGPEEITTMLDNLDFIPQALCPVLHLAKNASALDNLTPLTKTDLVDPEKDIPPLIKPVKKWISLLSLDSQLVSEYFPDQVAQDVESFKASVVSTVHTVLSQAQKELKEKTEIVDKYRQWQGVRMVGFIDKC